MVGAARICAEYHAGGTNAVFSYERFHEANDLIIAAWTPPRPFRGPSTHYHFQRVKLWPRPCQQPHPPIWVPSPGSSEPIAADWQDMRAGHLLAMLQFSTLPALRALTAEPERAAA